MAEAKTKGKRYIGIDYGMARIGIAYSDESHLIATPMMVLQTEKKTDRTINKLLNELKLHQEKLHYEIEAIVIGLPLLMSGKAGLLADEVKHFIEVLSKHTSIPLATWDERLTSVQAERFMRETSLTRKRRSKVIDTVSAVIILQNYLDHKKIQQDLLEKPGLSPLE